MPEIRHCRHCLLGGCPGDCLLEGGRCIHGWDKKPGRQFHWQLLLNRRWWRRVFWGIV